MAKKRLLVVHISLYAGGAERSLVNFLRTLPADRYEVDLMLFRREGYGLTLLPPHIHLVDPPQAVKWLFWNENSTETMRKTPTMRLFRGVRMLATGITKMCHRFHRASEKQLRWKWFYRHLIPKGEQHYDVAIAYLHGEMTYFVVDKIHADRKLAWVHNDYDHTGLSPTFDAAYYPEIDSIATISARCREILQKNFPTMQEKFVVLPNIVREDEIRAQAQVPPTDDLTGEDPVILSIGRLNYQKAPEWSIEAAAILKNRGIAFRWYWIGGSGASPELYAKIDSYGLKNQFLLLGVRKNPYPFIRQCDVFVQNSRYEGKSIVLDEAKILGKPIVVTDYPTVRDQIGEDEGVTVAQDPTAIADGIAALLSDPEKRKRLSDTLLSRHYGNEQSIVQYMEWIDG